MLENEKEIQEWLKENGITKYTMYYRKKERLIVDVHENVQLLGTTPNIEVQFGKIEGSFSCAYCHLTSLEGSPEIVEGSFDCSENNLTSLEGCPQIVKEDFDCSHNKIINLKYGPKKVYEDFNCSFNPINNIEELNCDIQGNFYHMTNRVKIKNFENLYKVYQIGSWNENENHEFAIDGKELNAILLKEKIENQFKKKSIFQIKKSQSSNYGKIKI